MVVRPEVPLKLVFREPGPEVRTLPDLETRNDGGGSAVTIVKAKRQAPRRPDQLFQV
jgi:hypothetical protein